MASSESNNCSQGDAIAATKRGRKRTLRPIILRAASDLFARSGFEQPTVNQIAEAAGVTKATLYVYFDGKSGLIDAVLECWLRDMSVVRPVYRDLPLRRQLVDVGHQLQELTLHPAVMSLAKRIDEIEQRLSPHQLEAWRTRYAEFEAHFSGILERNFACERSRQMAHQFLLLVTGDLDLATPASLATTTAKVESAVDLILLACAGTTDAATE